MAKDGIARKMGENSERHSKQDSCGDGGKTCSSAFGDTGSALYKCSDGGSTQNRSCGGCLPRLPVSAPLMRGSFPFSSSISALVDTPIRVPRVSKISTNRNAKDHYQEFQGEDPVKLQSSRRSGDRLGMASPLLKSGSRL